MTCANPDKKQKGKKQGVRNTVETKYGRQIFGGGERVSQAILGVPTDHSPQLAAPTVFLLSSSCSRIKLDSTLRIPEPQSLPFERGRGRGSGSPSPGLLSFGPFAQRPFPNGGRPNLHSPTAAPVRLGVSATRTRDPGQRQGDHEGTLLTDRAGSLTAVSGGLSVPFLPPFHKSFCFNPTSNLRVQNEK